jgi:hypothetical protein
MDEAAQLVEQLRSDLESQKALTQQAIQLAGVVVVGLVGGIGALWMYMKRTVSSLAEKLDESRSDHLKSERRCAKIEEAHSKELMELVKQVMGGNDAED